MIIRVFVINPIENSRLAAHLLELKIQRNKKRRRIRFLPSIFVSFIKKKTILSYRTPDPAMQLHSD